MIALARLVLIVFALAATYVDATQSRGDITATYTITGFYAAVAAIGAVFVFRRVPTKYELFLAHALDIALVSALIYLTEGPTSPFFVFFTFILLAGTLRWNWRGALGTAVILVVLFLVLLAIFGDQVLADRDELNRAIIRTGYLLVIGAMLGYVGAYRERSTRRLAQLVAWPGPQPMAFHEHASPNLGPPPIAPALAHAASLLCTPRVLVIWEIAEEPSRHVALWTAEDGLLYSREHAGRFGTLVAAHHTESTFSVGDADANQQPDLMTEIGSGRSSDPGRGGIPVAALSPLIDADLRRTYSIGRTLTAPFHLPLCKGRLFLLDQDKVSDDDLRLTELIALRLGVDLEHHLMRAQIGTTAALAERVRLARDLHDGVLQSLTAASIHLKLCSQQAGSGALAEQLTLIRETLTGEQRRVRNFVEDHRHSSLPSMAGLVPDAAAAEAKLADALEDRLRWLEREWGCSVEFWTSPEGLSVPRDLARHIRHLVAEAVSNAVRHGRASSITVSVTREPEVLRLCIADNGHGFADLEGSYGDEALATLSIGPRSLWARTKDLGGTVALRTSASGSELDIELPT
ncbi:sensor histidine kinase [Sabulicella rubraurantiaca]|uniref:sensor histidine kinase n=1 Tax=Sabulicella rubraurantiaca TaxID=2811429 RepID=UPI001A963D14|nr:histidine kinase [Sabulicella rubraurantiaca]